MSRLFTERLSEGPILADGAMGTELIKLANVTADTCLEGLNLTAPDLVKQVHLDYLKAGAELIETNTYGANRVRLGSYGQADSVKEINSKAVQIAREAERLTGQQVWIAGSVGPLGKGIEPLGPITVDDAREAFAEQIKALAAAGVDVLLLETFHSLAEIQLAVAVSGQVTDLPVIAQLTFNEEGRTLAGDSSEEVAKALVDYNLTAIGANCSVGSQPMLDVVEAMAPVTGTRLSALPNAGFPTGVDGRLFYLSSPAYMADYAGQILDAGASIIGGCCGTTPEHIAAIRRVMRERRVQTRKTGAEAEVKIIETKSEYTPPPPLPTELSRKLGKQFVVTVEVHPPRGFDVSTTLTSLRNLLGMVNVDAFNCTDIPLAQGRMSALAMSSLLQTRLGTEAIMHIATRYRNLLALQSDLLGAHALGVRNIFVFMGDPPLMGDYPQAVSFSDITSSGLIRLISQANEGLDTAGRPIEQATSFLVGCALNLEAEDVDKEQASLERKIAAGADFILPQAVFEPEAVEKWRQRIGGFPKPVILGVLPLRSYRHAEFLHNEVPGIVIPPECQLRMKQAGKEGGEMGITLAQELLKGVHSSIAGVYFVPSFGRYEAVAQVLNGLPEMVEARP